MNMEESLDLTDVDVSNFRCKTDFIQSDESSKSDLRDLLRHNMTSTCAPTYDVSDADKVKWRCLYQGPLLDENGTFRNARVVKEGFIYACDASQEESLQSQNDVIDLMDYKLGSKERKVDKTQIYCDFLHL